jgi:polygalacturonase
VLTLELRAAMSVWRSTSRFLPCGLLALAGCSLAASSDEGPSTSQDSPSTDESANGAAVQLYPAPPIAHPSKVHRARVGGQSVLVERYAGVGYVRFAFKGTTTLEVEVDAPITKHTVFPAERAVSSTASGKVLKVELASAESFVVWINDLEKLFVFPDAPLEHGPTPGAPGVSNVRDLGADATGKTLSTTAIQAAIDQATSHAGGGTVFVPPGLYRTGTIALKSNVTLHLAAGALLQGSADPSDYPVDPGKQESGSNTSLAADVRYLGRTMTFSRLLLVDKAENVRIEGRGTIDGEGSFLRMQHNAVPNLLRVRESKNVVIEDVLFRNAAAWSLHVLASQGVTFTNVKLVNDRANLNTDGIDPDMSSDVRIDRAFLYTKDDAVCIKATENGDLHGDPARITVTNSVVSSLDAGLKLGTESSAGHFSDVTFESNWVFDSGRAMSVVVRDGAIYDNVTYKKVRVGPHVDHLIEQVIGVRDPAAALGVIKNLTFDDVVAPEYKKPSSNWTWYAQFRPPRPSEGSQVNVFEGADALHAVEGLRLKNVVVNGVRIDSQDTARDVANVTIGPHVRNVTFE